MRLTFKIFITLLILLPLVNYSQQQFSDSEISAALNNPDTKKIRPSVLAAQQIETLKDGVLLIRLQNQQNTINALKKVKRFKEAEKAEYRQKELNLEYVKAFRSHFNFCKVYFFYSNHSQKIIDKKYDDVIFLNDSLIEDPTIKISSENIFTGEFTNLEQDTTSNFSRTIRNDGNKKLATYHGGPNFDFEVLAIKSNAFVQLCDPFPYYVRTFRNLPLERSPLTTIAMMNRRLHQYYYKQQRKMNK